MRFSPYDLLIPIRDFALPTMYIIVPLALLSLLKLLELSFMEAVSWWWIVGLAVLGFLWFEFFERMLGLDKGADELHHEKMRKNRIKRNFKEKK